MTTDPVHAARLKRTHLTSQLDKQVNREVVLAGWVHDVRVLGGISFLLLRDMDGIVQVTAPKAKAPAEILREIGTLHQEDVVVVRGIVVSSKIAKRGIEIIPSELEVLNRSETPLPLDPRGVLDGNEIRKGSAQQVRRAPVVETGERLVAFGDVAASNDLVHLLVLGRAQVDRRVHLEPGNAGPAQGKESLIPVVARLQVTSLHVRATPSVVTSGLPAMG